MDHQQGKYDEALRSKAIGTSAIRAVVAGYLVYLGYTLIRDWLRGGSTMSPWVAWGIGLLFCIGGAAFGLYTWKQYRAALKAAELPAEETEEAEPPEEA
jgi:TRAP-type C4-dicarboxylate transport system permease small subunit